MSTDIASYSQEITQILKNDLVPIFHMLDQSVWVIGFVLLVIGVHRLKHHQGSNNHRYHSPLATAFYVVGGVLFMGFGPELIMISQSTFGGQGAIAFLKNPINPINYYVKILPKAGGDINQLSLDLMYAVLVIIGTFAFVRGFLLMIKLGEGGQEATFPKAITHILAGAVAINFQVIYHMMQSFI